MSFSVDDVLAAARDLLQDDEKVRYNDVRLIRALNLAISNMRRVRPDIVALWQSIPNYPYTSGTVGGGVLLPVDDQFFDPLVSFVAGWVEMADDEFTIDNRANTLITRFSSQITLGG